MEGSGTTGVILHPGASQARKGQRKQRIIMVLKRLPLSIAKRSEGGWDIAFKELGPIPSAVRLMMDTQKSWEFVWVGGFGEDDEQLQEMSASERAELTEILRRDWNCVPVYVDELARSGWTAYCKRCLWPLLNSQLVTNKITASSSLWHDYKRCSLTYAQAISDELGLKSADIKEEEEAKHQPQHKQLPDLLWIHDYHLLLLPSLLRKMGSLHRIGFFFHTPFPTSEIFRILPERAKLLAGVLGSDLIGFQTYHDCRHFLSACTRILALDARPKGVEWNGRMVAVDIFPVGIDPTGLERIQESSEVHKRVQELKHSFANTKLIVGRDRLDPIKGIPQKLLAFEDFLSRFPEWQGKVVLFQVCLPPTGEKLSPFHTGISCTSGEVQELHSQINELVGRINGRWGTADFTPIHYLSKVLPIHEVVALYNAADVALLTPLRDGMNLTSHEYVVCQKSSHGPLILSEFAGSAQSLGGAVLVNPWDTRGVASAIFDALKMNEEEKRLKHQYNYSYIISNTALQWGTTFLRELQRVEHMLEVPVLKHEDVTKAYNSAKKRLFLLDYDGTLTPIVSRPADAVPSPALLQALQQLTSDPKNIVYIISGRDREFLRTHMQSLPVGLSCEHGVFFRHYGKDSEWENLSLGMETSWREIIMPILADYTERTPGSMIETKEVNVSWHYRNAEADFGSFQAKDLVVHLQNVASKLPIEILLGKKVIEVRPQNVHKGATVRKIVNGLPDVDFVLCIGDDKTDEDMFLTLANIFPHAAVRPEEEDEADDMGTTSTPATQSKPVSTVQPFSCVVSRKESAASYSIPTQADVIALLQELVAASH
eukprot:TRINITY_DN7408_c0_g1_i1.p1 TRINITY_DN7408_c0_g1~~TRINITY_DN7408_c0_g1_i1.p1  ORF type:complete len:827 (+),score=109.44 TRINITY_DN7408_c0_g1_i1:94-2574(+)